MIKYTLSDIADVIRSKNSGPFELTFDVIFKNYEMFEKIVEANIINEDMFSELYKIPKADITKITAYPPAKAVKITIIRPISSGALGETDVYGAGQHGPLLDFTFEV